MASVNRSRLPRPSLAPPSISNAKSSSATVPSTLPASTPFNKSNAGTAKKEDTIPKQNAFTLLMKKPMDAKQRMKEKAEKEQAAKLLHQVLKAGPSTSSQPLRPEKQKITAKERMRGKHKGRTQKTALFVPDEEEEDSHTEAELTVPTQDQNRFVASSNSPEPCSLVQESQISTSQDTPMASLSAMEVGSGDMVEQTALDDRPMPLGDMKVTAAAPSEKVIETAPLNSSPSPLLLEENASSINELTTLVPSGSGTTQPTSKLPRGKKWQPASVPIVDRVTRSVSLKQKGKDTNLQPGMFQAY